MPGPWEKYQKDKPAGPWTQYRQPSDPPPDTPAPPQYDLSGNIIPPSPSPGMPREALDPTLSTEFVRGAAGDVYGAGQLAGHVLPKTITDPISASRAGQQFKRFATAPTQGGIAGSVARTAGAAAPFVLQPELGAGAIGDAAIMGGLGGLVQPTESGSLPSHLGGAAAGAAAGGAGGALAGSPAQQAIRALGVRLTPGRMFGAVGRGWEHLASRLPVLNRLIGYGRQVSLDDFQHVLYRDALEPLQRWIGGRVPTATGSAGLDQLRTIVTDRLNNVIARSSLPASAVAALRNDVQTIEAGAVRNMSTDTVNRFGRILQMDVFDPITMNGGMLPGNRLGGRDGVISTLESTARGLWRSQDTQDRALASALDSVRTALLDHADIGAGGRPELDAARQAYARYITLSRAGSGATREGFVDSEALLARLRRENEDVFARGRMRLQPLATQARRAGVPRVAETDPEVGAVHTIAASLFHPAYLGSVPPALLYNRPGMSALQVVANQARRVGAGAGTTAGQTDVGDWLSSQIGFPP